jgi:polyhydroxyalkanoate synthase
VLFPDKVRNLVNQTGPVNFHDDGIFSLWTRECWLNVDLIVDTLGNVPAELLWMTFQSVNPVGAISRMIHFYEHMEDDQFVQDYVAMNTCSITASHSRRVFPQFVQDLYQRNCW